MVNLPELKKQLLPKRNKALVPLVSLALLSYAQNKRFNLFQKIISHYAFFGNISNCFIESSHQMGIIVSYESIWRGLQVNAKTVIREIPNKTRFDCFIILYDNKNFYEHVWDQQLHEQSAIVNYIARYIYFIKTLKQDKEDNTWLRRYINLTKINQKLVNIIASKDFNLIQTDHNH